MSTANKPLVEKLLAESYALEDSSVFVPEPVVKQWLSQKGVLVPKGFAATIESEKISGVSAPLVVKAWGPELLHKSDAGAVSLNHSSIDEAKKAGIAMSNRLLANNIKVDGLLFEEQSKAGIDLIVGLVEKPPFGFFVALGIGGIFAEILADVNFRPWPIGRLDVIEMIGELKGAPMLEGARGNPVIDKEALIDLMLTVGGKTGLLVELKDSLVDFEMNPVIATEKGVCAVDARLILRTDSNGDRATLPRSDFTPVFEPKTIVVAGASANKTNFGNVFLKNYRELGFTDSDHGGKLFAIHPSADSIDGVPAYSSPRDVPGTIDYMLVAVPAERCAALILDAKEKLKFVQVMSGGFRESGEQGLHLENELLAAVQASGARLLGPNCMGAWSARGRQTFISEVQKPPGGISVISQSGGLAGDILKGGESLGLSFAKLVTIGNSIDVNAGELLEWLVDDPETEIIALYVEDPVDGARLVEGLRRARGSKPVVMLASGLSEQGAKAAASHTGSLTGNAECWRGIGAQTGAALTKSLESFLDTLLYAQCHLGKKTKPGGEVLVIGPGGGSNVLATDSADRAGLCLKNLPSELQQSLKDEFKLGAGTSVANPIEVPVGPLAQPDLMSNILTHINSQQPLSDVLMHISVQAFFSYGDNEEHAVRTIKNLIEALKPVAGAMPLSLVLRNNHSVDQNLVKEIRRSAIAMSVPSYLSVDDATEAIAAGRSTLFEIG